MLEQIQHRGVLRAGYVSGRLPFTFFNDQTPQLYLDIDRVKAEKLGVNVSDVFQSLEIYMGSAFVNEFNYLGRTYQVTAQADAPNRLTPDDI